MVRHIFNNLILIAAFFLSLFPQPLLYRFVKCDDQNNTQYSRHGHIIDLYQINKLLAAYFKSFT